jgi:hypothetical protein
MIQERIDWKPILGVVPRIISTDLAGRLTVPHWPLSGSFYPPFLEIAGEAKTPNNLLPVVAALYYFIRNTDSTIDNAPALPSFNQIETATCGDCTLFLATVARAISSDFSEQIAAMMINSKLQVYQSLLVKEKWQGSPTYEQAFAYRFSLNQVTSDLTTEVWCKSTGVDGKRKEDVRETARHVAMIYQFRDDLLDKDKETSASGNLVLAIMREEGEDHIGKKSKDRIREGINEELTGIQNHSQRVYELFSNITKIKILFPV